MVLGINSLQPQNKIFFVKKFRDSLFFRLSFSLIIFTSLLIVILYYQFSRPIVSDTILDAQEAYFYSKMVENWGVPPNIDALKEDIGNLSLSCGVFLLDQDWNENRGYGDPYWASPDNFPDSVFYGWSYMEDFEGLDINIPLHVQFGTINESPATVVENNGYVYYFGTNYLSPNPLQDFIVPLVLIIILVIILYFFIRRYLYPVLLMKQRVDEFEKGDFDSTIPILGQDELASLSRSINSMTENIKILLNQKQMLLLDVSHELRTPLARMQLLLEMIPKHDNIFKLKDEIILLEGIISNLLLSDKLSTPYTDLELSSISINRLLQKVQKMFPDANNKIIIKGQIPDKAIQVDELKIILAIRNLLDNAVKYSSSSKKPCELSFDIEGNNLLISVKDFGVGIKKENINKLAEPFFRGNLENNIKGFGIGLTIVKKVIEAHNGELIINSNFGDGALFILKMPIII